MKSRGLTHIQLTVRDLSRSIQFYRSVLGLQTKFDAREDHIAFLTTPGTNDIITLNASGDQARAGDLGGVAHFGFHVEDIPDFEHALVQAVKAGGQVLERGFRSTVDCPNEPWAFVQDPDGYLVEIYSPSATVKPTEVD